MTQALQHAIDGRYAYRDVRGLDWETRFTEMRNRLEGAPTPAAFARAAAELFRINNDLHVTVEVNGIRRATGRRSITTNADPQAVARLVREWREFPGGAAGWIGEDIGYIAIHTWAMDEAAAGPMLAAIGSLGEAAGLIVDVRMNAGGNELQAQRVAGCFVEAQHVYSRNLARDPAAPDGWAGPFERAVKPGDGPRLMGKVGVLMGPACMSTTESFVLMMRRPGKRELFGARTWGSSGNPWPVENGGGITVHLSS